MRSNSNTTEDMEFLPTHDMLIRWQIASDYLNEVEISEKVGTAALKTLVDRDFPLLLVALRNSRFTGWAECAPRARGTHN